MRGVRVQTQLKRYLSISPNEGTPDANLISTSSATMPLTRPEGWYIDRFHLPFAFRSCAREPPSLFRLRLRSRPLNLSACASLSLSLSLSHRSLSFSTPERARCETLNAIMQLNTWAWGIPIRAHRCAFFDCITFHISGLRYSSVMLKHCLRLKKAIRYI